MEKKVKRFQFFCTGNGSKEGSRNTNFLIDLSNGKAFAGFAIITMRA